MSPEKLRCLRCVEEMECSGVRHLVVAGGFLGRLFGKRLALEVWLCPSCGKVEFFAAKGDRENLFDLLAEEGRG